MKKLSLFVFTLPLATIATLAPLTIAVAQQVTSDGTVSTTVTTPDGKNFNINDGTTRGGNLFHSFKEFSVPTGGSATFNNAANIQNIISRVTGGSVSTIDGLIRTLGKANLFLLNPAGIIFGPNASLNIGGSFLGSTAHSFVFDNNFEFSATNPQAPPLLTITAPIGLRYRDNPQNITNQSAGLQVASGNSFALVGGNVSLNDGIVLAPGGRIELGGLSTAGTVGLNGDGSLSFPAGVQRGDISLTNGATVDVRGTGTGSIAVNARNLDILGGNIFAGVGKGLTADNSPRGDIALNATGKVTINYPSRVTNLVDEGATGNAGDINIKAGDIFITNKASTPTNFDLPAALDTGPVGKGRAGNISLDANNSIFLTGQDVGNEDRVISTFDNLGGGLGAGDISLKANGSILLSNAYLKNATYINGDAGNIFINGNDSVSITANSSLFSGGPAKAGKITIQSRGPVSIQNSLVSSAGNTSDNINIFARSVSVTDGAELTTRTFDDGGTSGNININATDFVEIAGRKPFPLSNTARSQSIIYSALLTTSEQGLKGVSGDININTATLRVLDGASLRAESRSNFRGGNINVNANVLELTGGGQLLTNAFEGGNAGDINLKVADRVTISGSNPTRALLFNAILEGSYPELLGSAALRYAPEIAKSSPQRQAEFLLGSAEPASGIFASTSVASTGQGGNVKIATGKLQLQDGAKISVNSDGQGNAGNITLGVRDFLLLRRGSEISTTAGSGTSGDGGNITINSALIVAFPLENSDITANAFSGRGGKITIRTQGLFGIEPRSQLTPESDITAYSQQNPSLSGTINIITPDIDPSRGLFELTETVIDPAQQIAQNPCTKGFGSTFTITGRGGIPTDPTKILSSDNVRVDLVEPVASTVNLTNTIQKQRSQQPTLKKIIPAQGWIYNEKGQVVLVGYDPTKTGVQRSQPAPNSSCAALR
ncbi:MAG: filamentous hemagglutinin N-terminal domain-containing protein [Brasilonema angustatum HA4187-MV1]|jgi:filamentous hemagglutinin family protein|nr:filamentous hemagglutinin N-terminal domain-containing protein [Brasilonema angustatum HA4187-MV1]